MNGSPSISGKRRCEHYYIAIQLGGGRGNGRDEGRGRGF